MIRDGIYRACISARRPHNVERMEALCGPLTWFVAPGDTQAYLDAGASAVAFEGGLCESRNAALDAANELLACCWQTSDDLRSAKQVVGAKEVAEVGIDAVLSRMVVSLLDSPFRLAGVAPTANAFYFHHERPVHINKFIVGDCIVVAPGGPRFDTELKLKEDYDFTLQHLDAYGGALRFNDLMMQYAHRTNKGGAVDYRTAEREQEAIAYLQQKWPGRIRLNPRRANEVLLV